MKIYFYFLITDTETLQTSHSKSFTGNIKERNLESTVTPLNIITTSKEACTASSATKESDDSIITQSYETMKKKDNILSSTNKEISTRDTYQSKSTVKTKNIKAPST